jgi:NADPH:quinone reductase-like Zn-dependent oxidoreductase
VKAIVMTRFGPPDVLQLQEVAKPAPRENEVLIRIHATTVFAADCELRGLKFPVVFRPIVRLGVRIFLRRRKERNLILGQEVAGEIEAVGKEVTRFREGDQVFGWTGLRMGGYAEYICLPEKGMLAIKPPNLTYEEAASVPVGGIDAVYYLRMANIRRGERVLINGAGGSIGTLAVQLARHFGAEVTAVDSTEKLEMLRSIGADHVVDYTREDFTKKGETYDVIFDVVGKSPFARSVRSLTPNGRYLINNARLSKLIRGPSVARRSSKQVIIWQARTGSQYADSLSFLRKALEEGTIKPIIDRCYPMEQIVEAHRYVDAGHKKGNVVITVANSTK